MSQPSAQGKINNWISFLERSDPRYRKTKHLRVCTCHVVGDDIVFSSQDYEKVIAGLFKENIKKDVKIIHNKQRLSAVFNDDQIQKLFNQKDDNKVHWCDDTLFKALIMRSKLSNNGYEMLRTLLHWPLPSEKSIGRRIKDIEFLSGVV